MPWVQAATAAILRRLPLGERKEAIPHIAKATV